MFATLALTLLAPMAGAVGEPTPISAAIVEIVIADPATGTPLCDAYRQLTVAVDSMGLGADGAIFVEAADAFLIVTMEGDSMRLDNGARDALTNWLHTSCS